QPLQSKLLAAAAYIAPPAPSLPPLPERRTLSLLHLPRRTIPGIPRRRLPGPLLPRPYSESLSLRTPRPPLNHISDQNQDGVGRTLTLETTSFRMSCHIRHWSMLTDRYRQP